MTKTLQEELRTVADDLAILAIDVMNIRRSLITDLCDEEQKADDEPTVEFLRQLLFKIDDATVSILRRLK